MQREGGRSAVVPSAKLRSPTVIGKLTGVVLILALGAAAGELAAHQGHPAHESATVKACGPAPRFISAAYQNSRSVATAAWSVFGRPETGWAIYAPLAAREIGVDCPPDAQGFAGALASWQEGHRLPATGIMDEATLRALDRTWQSRRPFVAATAHGACPAPPAVLADARIDEGYGGKQVQLRAGA